MEAARHRKHSKRLRRIDSLPRYDKQENNVYEKFSKKVVAISKLWYDKEVNCK